MLFKSLRIYIRFMNTVYERQKNRSYVKSFRYGTASEFGDFRKRKSQKRQVEAENHEALFGRISFLQSDFL